MSKSGTLHRYVGWMSLLSLIFLISLSTRVLAESNIRPDDDIILEMEESLWVKAEKAKVIVSIDAAMASEEAKNLRQDVNKSLAGLSKEVDWKLTGFSRRADNTGLERWHVTAEGRLDDAQLAGLESRAKKVSRAGLQVNVAQVNFTPSPAEIEAARKELRKALYKRVTEEIAMIEAVIPTRKFEVGRIDFTNGVMPVPQPRMFSQKANMDRAMISEAMHDGGGLNTGRELSQHVFVRLVATPVATD